MKEYFKLLQFVILITLPAHILQAQITVTGRVIDIETNEPLAGATVSEFGKAVNTITDENGAYRIMATSNNSSLIFSFTGYQSQTVKIAGAAEINIRLMKLDATLGEVVVVGYGSQSKTNLTGAVSTVAAKDLVKVPSANISEVLIGKAPGLFTKQTQGAPGDDYAALRIRGFGAPLVLVDGVETSWTRMDPNEIESISILKDASAAIYGSRAGNGVILITTKRGKQSDHPIISYNGSLTFQEAASVPEAVSSWKYAELLREGELNSSLPFTFTEEEIQKFKSGDDPDYPNENWYRAALIDWAPMQSHSVNVSGGSNNIKYFMTAGYLNQASIYRSGDLSFNRYNVRTNIDAQVSKGLAVGFDLSYRNELRLSPASTLDVVWTNLKSSRPIYPAHLPDPAIGGSWGGLLVRSPIGETRRDLTGFEDNLRRYVDGRIRLNYQIPSVPGLNLEGALNYSINYQYTKTQNRPFSVYTYKYASKDYQLIGTKGANNLTERFSEYTQIYPMISVKYNQIFGKHKVNGLLLAESIDTRNTFMSAGRVDLLSLEIPYLFAGSNDNITNNGSAVETGRVSYVGRAEYAFNNRYLLEGTFRYDASHKFAPKSRWGFFPSLSAGWRISEEPFMKNGASWINSLKIRGSISRLGDDNVDAFKYLTGYEILKGLTNVYVFGTDVYPLIQSTGLPNPDITWLTMTIYNMGLDATLFDGAFGFEFDAFSRVTENIFGEPLENFPSTFGAALPQLNINSKTDRGIEFTINHRNKLGGSFFYSVDAIASLSRSYYLKWSEPKYEDADEIRIFKKTGNRTNRWIGYRSDGIFMSQEEINTHSIIQDEANNTTLRPGDIKYIDLNGDGIIDWRDQDIIGAGSFPDLTYSLNLRLEYKRLNLTALFQGASLYNFMIGDVLRSPLQNLNTPYEFHYKYRWQPDPENPNVNINRNARLPAMIGDGVGSNTNNNKTSDFWLKDGTYLRLRNVNISYTVNGKWTNKIGLLDLSIYVAGSNLLTWSNLGIYRKSLDPEATDTQKFYPPVRTYAIGLNVKI